MPFKLWGRERLLSSELQAYLQDQVVATFPTASARATAITDPKTGQLTWLDIPGVFEFWDGSRWRPQGGLRVPSKAQLPVNGSLGMEAVDDTGQRWEWRAVNGVEQWTWPRAAQGTLVRQDFTTTVALSSTPGPLTAILTPTFDVPAGRRLHVHWDGASSASVAGTAYGYIAQLGGAERRKIVHHDAANVAYGWSLDWEIDVATAVTGWKVTTVGGLIAGTGLITFGGGTLDLPVQLIVRDVGATTAGAAVVQA